MILFLWYKILCLKETVFTESNFKSFERSFYHFIRFNKKRGAYQGKVLDKVAQDMRLRDVKNPENARRFEMKGRNRLCKQYCCVWYLRNSGGSWRRMWKSFSLLISRSRWCTAHLKLRLLLPLIYNTKQQQTHQ